MTKYQENWRETILALLLLLNLGFWLALYTHTPNQTLKVFFLDIGQGDATFIETPDKHQVLIDGGKNKKVISELGKIMRFSDRKIDVVIATHPDADHIGGLPLVLDRYKVGVLIESPVENSSELQLELDKREVERIYAKRGMVINFGDGVYLEILFPNQNVSKWETNDASIVVRLIYGESTFLLTGDSPLRVENILMMVDSKILDVDVLKVGHHGSRTSSGEGFIKATSPEYAVVSAGKDNSYGHPHVEVINNLENFGAKIFYTAFGGTIRFETDGENLILK